MAATGRCRKASLGVRVGGAGRGRQLEPLARPGDVWCMPGDKEHGYVRWNCYHGLPHDEIKEECQPGCTKCRISLNLRYGYARSP